MDTKILMGRLAVAMALGLAVGCGPTATNSASSASQPPAVADQSAEAFETRLATASTRGVEFLLAQYDKPMTEGGWGPNCPFVGANGLALNALLRTYRPAPADHAAIAATIDSLLEMQELDGAWVSQPRGEAVYETSVVLRALIAAVKASEKYKSRADIIDAIRKGRQYLLKTQVDEIPEFEGDATADESNPSYGGFGYGRRRGSDPSANLSVTHMAMDAIEESTDVAPATGDEIARARAKLSHFLRQVHNLPEAGGQPYNTKPVEFTRDGQTTTSMPGTDGGAMYAPGISTAGYDTRPDGTRVPRSYGSMTYSLLRMYQILGLSKDDPRMKAAFDWIRKAENFAFDKHPGMRADNKNQPYQGHFYFLYSAASTLDELADDGTITDSKNEPHDWKRELGAVLLELQGENGSWVNSRDQSFQEGQPLIATGFALMALGHLQQEK